MQHLAVAKPPPTLMENPKRSLVLQASHLLYSPAITQTFYLQANYTYSFVDIGGLLNVEKKKSIGIEQMRGVGVHFWSVI